MCLDPCVDVRLVIFLHARNRRFRRLGRLHLPGDLDWRAVGAVLIGARCEIQRKHQDADRYERNPPRFHRFLQPVARTFGGSPGVDKAVTMMAASATCGGECRWLDSRTPIVS